MINRGMIHDLWQHLRFVQALDLNLLERLPSYLAWL